MVEKIIKVISNLKILSKMNEIIDGLNTHTANTNNPHNVTAEQLGLATAYVYKGSVTNFSDLPTNAQNGWVYSVENAHTDSSGVVHPAGANFAWDGSKWDDLGGSLSGYATVDFVENRVIPIANGGTGATTISAACKALGLDWDWFHRYGLNYVPSDVTNNGWNSLGLCLIYYTKVKIKNQPTTYGQLLNIPADQYHESTQIWIEQASGALYFRGGNDSNIVNDEVFTRVATEADVSSAGYGIVAANLAQNGYVKFANGLILQWGVCDTENYHAFPITFGTVFSLVALPNYNTNRYQNLVYTALDSYGFTVSMSGGDTSVPTLFFAIGKVGKD